MLIDLVLRALKTLWNQIRFEMMIPEKLRCICLVSSAIIFILLLGSTPSLGDQLYHGGENDENMQETRKLRNDAAALSLSLGMETSILTVNKKKKNTPKTTVNSTIENSEPLSNRKVNTAGKPKDELDEVVMGVDENGTPVRMKGLSKATTNPKAEKVVKVESTTGGISPIIVQNQSSVDVDLSKSADRITSEKGTAPTVNILETVSSTASESRNVPDQLFYMYDLPEEFWWRWPKPDTDCRYLSDCKCCLFY